MEKPLKFKEVFMPYPNPENQYTDDDKKLQPKMDFESEDLKKLYLKHKENLIETAIKECAEYLDADDWMDEEIFPCIKDLTGEWYLASVTVQNQDKKIIVKLYLHFLGYYPKGCARKEIDDYLGMEAWFVYEPIQKIFCFDSFNTDAI